MKNGRKECERVEYDEKERRGTRNGNKRGEALKRTLLHELIGTKLRAFLS